MQREGVATISLFLRFWEYHLLPSPQGKFPGKIYKISVHTNQNWQVNKMALISPIFREIPWISVSEMIEKSTASGFKGEQTPPGYSFVQRIDIYRIFILFYAHTYT